MVREGVVDAVHDRELPALVDRMERAHRGMEGVGAAVRVGADREDARGAEALGHPGRHLGVELGQLERRAELLVLRPLEAADRVDGVEPVVAAVELHEHDDRVAGAGGPGDAGAGKPSEVRAERERRGRGRAAPKELPPGDRHRRSSQKSWYSAAWRASEMRPRTLVSASSVNSDERSSVGPSVVA